MGIFGNGPLSDRKTSKENWSIQYQRLGYFEAEQTYQIKIKREAIQDNQIKIWIDNEAIKRMSISKITPEPVSAILSSGKSIFVFAAEEGKELSDIYFSFKPKTFGAVSSKLGLVGGSSLELQQFYWP
jgi:hypothetical protein